MVSFSESKWQGFPSLPVSVKKSRAGVMVMSMHRIRSSAVDRMIALF